MNRTLILITIVILIIAGLILAFYIGSQKPEITLIPDMGVSVQATVEVNKFLATKIQSSDNQVTVYLPANSIKNDGYLVLTSMEPNLFTEANGEWKRPIIVNINLYSDLGKLITKPDIDSYLEICFLLDKDLRSDYIKHREKYYIQYYDESDQGEWKNLNYSVKSNNEQLCGEIDHLTLFSLAIRGEAKETLPTSIEKPYQIPPK